MTAAEAARLAGRRAEQELAPWRHWREGVRAAFVLGAREVRTSWRTPAYFIPNLIVPIFFYFVMVGSLNEFAGRSGIGNWEAFQVPVSIIFAVQGGSAGLNMVADIESGYFYKLLATPASRLAILVGAMAADFIRIVLQASLVVVVAELAGLEFATGFPGAVALVLLGSLWGLAYSGVGFAVALKSGNSQTTQSMWFLFMPLMFLTTNFAPKEALSGWLKTAATLNPLTYVLEGMRALAMRGWDASDIGGALLAAVGLGSVSITLALLALRGRVR
jgi:ABC-2 type transport system permease protein